MSHLAMNWALSQRQLKPGPWIVLIQLADRHNKDTKLCRPEQVLLAHDCNMSRATLNRHLAEIEEAGLIQRVARVNPATRKQLATQYILQIDFDAPPDVDFPASQFETRDYEGQNENETDARVSICDTVPCLKNGQSRVSKIDNPVSQIETPSNPVREPKNEPKARGARDGVGEGFSDDDFEKFWAEFPEPVERDAARKAFAAVIDGGEADAQGLIVAASRYAASGPVERGFVMKPANWLARGSWRDTPAEAKPADAPLPPAEVDLDAVARFWVDPVKQGRAYAATGVRPAVARHMLAQGLVTEGELRRAGVSL